MPTSTTSPIAILRRLAAGELSPAEARLALEGIPSSQASRPQRKASRKPIGKRSKPTPVSWEKPVSSWEDVVERYQWAVRFAPSADPWEVFSQARDEYHALSR